MLSWDGSPCIILANIMLARRHTTMNDHRKLRPLGTAYCRQYQTLARFYVEPAEPNNIQHLVVQYDSGRKELRAGIPRQLTDTELLELLRSPAWEGMRYPVWEHSARYFANPMLVWPSD